MSWNSAAVSVRATSVVPNLVLSFRSTDTILLSPRVRHLAVATDCEESAILSSSAIGNMLARVHGGIFAFATLSMKSGNLITALSFNVAFISISCFLIRCSAIATSKSAPPSSSSPSVAPPQSAGGVRNVVVEVDDSRRIVPDKWQAQQGEAVRLIVVNIGQSKHELLVGPADELAGHVRSMSEPSTGHHGHNNAVSVEPGQTATMLLTFDAPGEWGMACLEPGHFDGGMDGMIDVEPKT